MAEQKKEEPKKTRAPRTPKVKTFADRRNDVLDAFDALHDGDREKLLRLLHATYPHPTTVTREA